MDLIAQVTVDILTRSKLQIFALHVGKRIMLEISIDLVNLGLKLGNFLFRRLFSLNPRNECGRRHDFG